MWFEEGNFVSFEVCWSFELQMDLLQLDVEMFDFDDDGFLLLEMLWGFGLCGQQVEQLMFWCDCYFEQVIGFDFCDNFEGLEGRVLGEWWQEKYDEFVIYGYQVGGYFFFMQEDFCIVDDFWILLF